MRGGGYMAVCIYVYIGMSIHIKHSSAYMHVCREKHLNMKKVVLPQTEQPITISRISFISQLRNFKLLLCVASIVIQDANPC